MALFGSKNTGEKKKVVKKPAAKPAIKKVAKKAPGKKAAPAKTVAAGKKAVFTEKVLLRPHVTEKAAHLTAQSVYTFDISPRATKRDVSAAVHAVYGVSPRKIAIVNTPSKRVRMRRKRGFGSRAATKKAYVYLKEGDRIEFSS